MTALAIALRGLIARRHERAEPAASAASAAPARVRAADPDLALVGAARNGDREAFRALVDRHRDRACALALRVLRSPDDAEEAAQDAFLKAWRSLPGFRGDAAFGTWLHRITLRVALDRAESLKHRRTREAPIEDAATLPAPPPTRAEHAVARRLEHLLAGLSPAQRAVVTLHYWQGCPVRDIAQALDLSENTVKTHLRRARLGLREAWLEGNA
jgi:RNA polymerase sigma-70 factor (ECF subfamily)